MTSIYAFYTLFSLTLGNYFFITSRGPIPDFYQLINVGLVSFLTQQCEPMTHIL